MPCGAIENKYSLKIDQSKFSDCNTANDYAKLHALALARLEKCNSSADYDKFGVRPTRFPTQPSIFDYTPASQANANSSNSVFHAESMTHFISEFGPGFSMVSTKRLNWKLTVYESNKSKRKRGKNNEYHAQPLSNVNDLLGKPKLFGGFWTRNDLQTLRVLSQAIKTKEVIFDLKSARHSTIVNYYAMEDVFKRFVPRSDNGLVTGWEELRNKTKLKECHHEDKTNKQGYCKQMELYDLCKPANWMSSYQDADGQSSYLLRRMIWAHPSMKNKQGKYYTDAIQLGREVPIKHWPDSLVPSVKSETDHRPPLARCDSFEKLSVHEQIQLLWTLRAVRIWLEYLHSRFQMYSTDPGLISLRAFVKNLCTPPAIALRASQRLI